MENKYKNEGIEIDISEKYNVLKKIEADIPNKADFLKDELDILKKLSYDEDDGIRSEVARLLVDFTEKNGEDILLRLIEDKDELVRVEACDSLSQSESFETLNILIRIGVEDKSELVRGYAISSIGEISIRINKKREVINYLKDILSTESNIFPLINIYKILYLVDEKKYIYNLLELINTEIYQNRCAVIHNLEEIINEENKELIRISLKERLNIEEIDAVKSTISSLLSKICEE